MKWPIVRVGDIAEQLRGVTYAKVDAKETADTGLLPILRAQNITEGGLTFTDLVYVPEACISTRQLLQKGDVVIAASSGSLDVVGKAARATEAFMGSFGAFCKVLRPRSDIDSRFFGHFFKTPAYRRRISALAAGININNLRGEHLDELKIPLPPMEEQRRIAAILDQAEALRAKRRQALAKLDTLTQSLFLEMFGDPSSNSKRWPVLNLGSLIESGPQNGLYLPATDYGSGVPILRIDGFYDGQVTSLKTMKRLRVNERDKELYALQEGDIVINRVNSLEYLGKSALIPALTEPTVFESNMMRFRVLPGKLDNRYFIQLLQTRHLKLQVLARAKNAVNQSSINQDDVRSFRIPVPPLDLQAQFCRDVRMLEALDRPACKSEQELERMFQSLQHRAFRGEL